MQSLLIGFLVGCECLDAHVAVCPGIVLGGVQKRRCSPFPELGSAYIDAYDTERALKVVVGTAGRIPDSPGNDLGRKVIMPTQASPWNARSPMVPYARII